MRKYSFRNMQWDPKKGRNIMLLRVGYFLSAWTLLGIATWNFVHSRHPDRDDYKKLSYTNKLLKMMHHDNDEIEIVTIRNFQLSSRKVTFGELVSSEPLDPEKIPSEWQIPEKSYEEHATE